MLKPKLNLSPRRLLKRKNKIIFEYEKDNWPGQRKAHDERYEACDENRKKTGSEKRS